MMTQQEIDNEKHNIGMEILRFRDIDKAYVYTLIVYALQQKYITEDEASIAKADLDNYYSSKEETNKEETNKNSNKYMMSIFKKIGFTPAKVLWFLIKQFPKRYIGDPIENKLIPDNDKIIKDTKIPSVSYYDILNELVNYGYISKEIVKGKKMVITIHFDTIMQVYKDDPDKK